MFKAHWRERDLCSRLWLLPAAVVALAAIVSPPAIAQVTWDATVGTSGPQDGAGTWSTSASGTNWWDGTTNVAWPNLSTSNAIFGAGSGAAGTVTVSDSVLTNAITFNAPGSGTYTLSGGTISLAGSTPTITANADASIGSQLAGSAGLSKAGAGTLTLSGSNSHSGGTRVDAGTLVAANSSALGSGTVTLAGGGLTLNPGVTLTNSMELTAGQTDLSVFGSGFLSVEYLVVAGGGGGGGGPSDLGRVGAGGGGAGGYRVSESPLTLSSGSYAVTVGAGGAGAIGGASGADGGDSIFASITATGGGGGARAQNGVDHNGRPGGSGGGGSRNGTGGSGTSDQGFAGGNGSSTGDLIGGGGGGAGSSGANGGSSGNGGTGVASSITGTSVTRAGGGGGGGATGGAGQAGGGDGGFQNLHGSSASANTGSGGGGGGAGTATATNGGAGGSGIVIVRYQGPQAASGGLVTTGSGSAAGYTIHTFTDVGTSGFEINEFVLSTLSGNLSGVGGIQKSGTYTLVLSGSNSFSGDTTVVAGGLRLDHAHALGGSTFTGGAGTLDFGSLPAATLGGLSGSSSLLLSNSSAAAVALSVGANNQSSTFSGGLSGPGSLAKIGSGTLALSGSSSYAGSTAVNAGQLTVNGVLDTSGVEIASGAILGGSGVINGPVTVLAGGIVAPGNSPGTLTVNGAYSLADTSILNFELNPINTTVGGGINDLITGVTDLTLDGILNLGTGDWTAAATNSSWRLFDYSGTLTNNTLSLGTTPSLGGGRSFEIDTSTENQVNLVIVPEPAAIALAGIGIAAAGYALRRRKEVQPGSLHAAIRGPTPR